MLVAGSSMQMTKISALLGVVEKQELEKTMSSSEIDENISLAIEHGFTEISDLEFAEMMQTVERNLATKTIEPPPMNAVEVAWKQLVPEYRTLLQNNPSEYLSTRLQMFHVYRESVHCPSDLRLNYDSRGPTVQTLTRNLIFEQDLTISGNFDAGEFTSELPLFVIVRGNLTAKNLIVTGWTELVVLGDVTVLDLVFGFDGETGGRLMVHGNLTAANVLAGAMFPIEVTGQTRSNVFWLDNDEPTLAGAQLIPAELNQWMRTANAKKTPLVDGAYFTDSNWANGEEIRSAHFEAIQVIELIRNGQTIWR